MAENNVLINSEDKELVIEHLYTVEGYFTFNIRVKSGRFAGASNFCIQKEKLVSIAQTLSVMHKELKGCCNINDSDSDAFISIEMDKFGHIYINGQIGGSHEEHFMKFKYTTDQTVLEQFVRLINDLM